MGVGPVKRLFIKFFDISSKLERITHNFSIDMGKRVSLIFVFVFTIIAVMDSTIVQFFTYNEVELPISSNVDIFILFYLTFAASGIILLIYSKNSIRSDYKLSVNIRHFYRITFTTHIGMTALILIIVIQMIVLNKYNIFLLNASTYLTHTVSIIFLATLVWMLVGWLRSNRNRIIFLYALSFSLVLASLIVSMIYLEHQFSRSYSIDRKPYPIFLYVIRQDVTPLSQSLNTVFDFLSVISFSTIWIASIALLNEYRFKVGKIKFFVLISIPLAYYLLTFNTYFGNVFSPLVLNSPVEFGKTYVLIFSAPEQVGAFLFSLAFWTASSVIVNKRFRKSLLISSIGIVMLFGSIEITTLQYRLYPPFGLVTEAFIPLGSYLVLIGIFNSAINVAHDRQLRKDIYSSAKSQLSLLNTIGVTQMEKELLKKIKSMEQLAVKSGRSDEHYAEEEDVKGIVREVLNELYHKNLKRTEE